VSESVSVEKSTEALGK